MKTCLLPVLWLLLAVCGPAWQPALAQAVAEGDVSLVAGVASTLGTADGALGTGSFNEPSALVVDDLIVYIADRAGCAIREIDLTDGSISTLSGLPGTCGAVDGAAGTARFDLPGGFALDGTDLYVADNAAIRVIDTIDGSVTTLAGVLASPGAADGEVGTGLFDDPLDVALDDEYQLLYVPDNHAIRVVDIYDGYLSTLTGTLGSFGAVDGAPGTALFDYPVAVQLSSGADVLFVADRDNHAVRSVDVSTGDVSTYAGVLGSLGATDGALGTNLLTYPDGLALRGGRLYVSTQAHVIREVDMATLVVSTLAGVSGTSGYVNGAAGTAKFNTPRGMAASGDRLYVGDALNHVVRAVVIPSVSCYDQPAQEFGGVCTVAGVLTASGDLDGPAGIGKLDGPYGIATSGTNLYVAEALGCAIRKVDTTDGSTTTLSGLPGSCGATDGIAGQARFDYPAGLAISGTTLYVADHNNHCIRTVDTTDGYASTFSGARGTSGSGDGSSSAARFYEPTGLAIFGDSLYVTDALNHAIRAVALSDGSVTTLAGTMGTSGAVDTISGSPLFNLPWDLAISEDGAYLYVADKGNHAIRSVHVPDGAVATYAGILGTAGYVEGPLTTNELTSPAAVARLGDRLYVGGANHAICVVDMTTQEMHGVAGSDGINGAVDGPPDDAEFNQPLRLMPAEDGKALYVSDVDNHAVRKILIPPTCNADPATADYEVCTLSGIPGVDGDLDGAAGLATFSTSVATVAWAEGLLYVADTDNHAIRYIDTMSGSVVTLAGELGTPGAVNGDALTARFQTPEGIAVSGGTLYIADTHNHAIRAVDRATGATTTVAGVLGSQGAVDGALGTGKFTYPVSVAVHGARLYVSDHSNHAIRTVLISDGSVSTLTGTLSTLGSADGAAGTALFNHPVGIVLAGDTLYVADRDNHAIRAVDVDTGTVSTVAGALGSHGGVDGALGTNRINTPLTVAVSGNNLYISGSAHAVRSVDLSSGIMTTEAGALGSPGSSDGLQGTSRFSMPRGIAAASSRLYVADSNNHAVRMIQLPAFSCAAAGDICTVAGIPGSWSSGHVDGPAGTGTLGHSEHVVISGTLLYVADFTNCAIRTVDTTNGAIGSLSPTSYDGCGAMDGDSNTALFSEPAGLALSGTSLYVADFGNHAIRVVDTTDGSVTTLSGALATSGAADGSASAARFDGPRRLALSGTSLYVADFYNHAIRVVDTTDGSVTTLTGTLGTSGAVDGSPSVALFDSPIGLALYGATLYVADFSNNAIRGVNTATGDVTTLAGQLASADPALDGTATTARMTGPYDLAVDGDTLYFVGHSHALRTVDLLTGDVATFAGLLDTHGVVDGNGAVASFHHPTGLALDGTDMYVLDCWNYLVRKAVLPVASPPPPPPAPAPAPAAAASGQCEAAHTASRCKSCTCGGSIKDRMMSRIRYGED